MKDVDKGLLAWFSQARAMHATIDGNILEVKAEELAKELGINRTPSKAWVQRWRRRHNIGRLRVCRELHTVMFEFSM